MGKKVNIADIKLSQKLGSGTGGVVHKATFQDEEIAVKVFDTQHPTNKKNAEREIIHLSHISHENVIQVFGTAKDGNKQYLLMEYLKDGSVHDLLYGNNQWEYTVEQAVRWAFQGAKALAHLHSLDRPVVHRDIKPQNMLLDNMFEKLKICDFGLATDMSNNQSDMRGTVRYMAPEAIRYTKYTDKCDVYSFGIVLWELMARKVPYSHLENADEAFSILEAVDQGDRPDMNEVRPDCPQGIKQLIKCCLDEDPEKRPSMKEIEAYLGKQCETGENEDFILPMDEDTVAAVTYHEDPSDGGQMMLVELWRRNNRPARITIPIGREVERLGKVIARETGRAAQDVGVEVARAAKDGERETRRAEKDTERETSRAAHDGERETRRAAQDLGRETKRAFRKIKKPF